MAGRRQQRYAVNMPELVRTMHLKLAPSISRCIPSVPMLFLGSRIILLLFLIHIFFIERPYTDQHADIVCKKEVRSLEIMTTPDSTINRALCDNIKFRLFLSVSSRSAASFIWFKSIEQNRTSKARQIDLLVNWKLMPAMVHEILMRFSHVFGVIRFVGGGWFRWKSRLRTHLFFCQFFLLLFLVCYWDNINAQLCVGLCRIVN